MVYFCHIAFHHCVISVNIFLLWSKARKVVQHAQTALKLVIKSLSPATVPSVQFYQMGSNEKNADSCVRNGQQKYVRPNSMTPSAWLARLAWLVWRPRGGGPAMATAVFSTRQRACTPSPSHSSCFFIMFCPSLLTFPAIYPNPFSETLKLFAMQRCMNIPVHLLPRSL